MNENIRKVNRWFKTATRADVDKLLSDIILTERQSQIFNMFYIKGKNIGFIADTENVCPLVVSKELKSIRDKILTSGDLHG